MNYRTKIYYKSQFKSLLTKLKTSKLSEPEEVLYKKILYLSEWEDLLEWQTSVLEEQYQKKKSEKGWFGFLSRGENEVFVPEVYIEDYTPKVEKLIPTVLNLLCLRIELRLGTYNLQKILIQSQTLSLMKCAVNAIFSEQGSDLSFSIDDLLVEYKEENVSEVLIKMSSFQDQPSMFANFKLFSDIKMPNEVKYVSQIFEIHGNAKAFSHLLNFVSLKTLSENKKKKIVDKLKNIQDMALSQISDIFYYEKTYKIEFFSPCTKVIIPAENGIFVLNLSNLSIHDRAKVENEFYTSLDASLSIEVLFNTLEIIPIFKVQLDIRTLNKIALVQKWANPSSPFDSLFDIEISGKVEEFMFNFYILLINEFKFLEKTLKLYETNEVVVLNKATIMKDLEAVNSVELINGFYSQKCMAVLNGDSIYFFQDEKTTKAFDFYVVTGASIQRNLNEIVLVKQSKTIKLNFSKETFSNKWFTLLITKVKGTAESIQVKKMEKEMFRYSFVIQKTKAKVISTELEEWYTLTMDHHELVASYNDFSMKFSINTHSVSAKNSQKEDLFYFGNQDFLEKIDLNFFKRESKFYSGQDVEIFLNFQSFHLFFSKSALAQILSLKSSVTTNEVQSEKVERNIMKIAFKYNISQIFIDFFKDVREVGKFELGNISGMFVFEGNSVVLDGKMSSMKVLWKEKENGKFVNLIDLADGKESGFVVRYQKDLRIETKIDSANIFYMPGVVKSIKKYFEAIMPEETQVDAPQVTESFEISTQITIENFGFSAKKLYSHKECFSFCVVFAQVETSPNEILVTLGKIQGTSNNLMLVHQESKIRLINSNTLEINSNDVSLYLTASDLHYLLNFFDPVQSPPLRQSQVKSEDTEIKGSIVLINIDLQLIDKLEKLSVNSECLQIEVQYSVYSMNLEILSPELLCIFNDKSVAEFSKSSQKLVSINISDQGYKVDLCPIEILYNQKFVEFIKYYIDTVLAVNESLKVQVPSNKFEYEVNLSELQIKIMFGQVFCRLSTDMKIKYLVHKQDCLIDFNELSIINYEDSDFYELLENCKVILSISFESGSYSLMFPQQLTCNISQDDIEHFHSFFMQDLPRSPVSESTLATVSNYQVEFSVICLNLLTKYRENFIQATLQHDECKIKLSSKTELDILSQLSLNYFSPLIQSYECLVEPFNFRIIYTYENLLSNLSFTLANQSELSLCLTDTILKDLYSRYYESSSKIQNFSLYNNTGHKVRLIYSDQSFTEIEDKDIKPVKPVKSDEYLSLALILENFQEVILNRLPLHIEGIHQHQLNKAIEIISQIEIVGQTKQIKVSSPVEIRNQTQIQFSVAFFMGNSNEPVNVKIVYPLCIISVPLNCCKGKVAFIPPGTLLQQCKIVNLSQILESSPFCKSGDYSFLLQYEKPVISIWPSLIIKNILPTYISVSFNNTIESLIQPNEFQHFYIPPTKTALYLTVNQFDKTGAIFIFDKKITKTVQIKNQKFVTEIGLLINEENSTRVTFYPYYLITNLSMIPISFYIQFKNSFINISKDFRDNKFFIGKVENLLIEINNCFSSPLMVDSLEKKSFEISNHGSILKFVHCTTMAKIPGENKYTKVFTVWSKYILTNYMDHDIKVIQTETDPKNFTFVKSGKSNYFNWAKNDAKSLMSLRIEKVSVDWTGGFFIEKSGTFYLKIENAVQKVFVKVNVKEEDGIVNVIFYNAYESDIKIVNKCKFLAKAHQFGCQLFETIEPGSEEYFAWYSQGLKEELVIKLNYCEIWQSFILDVEKVGKVCACEFPDFPNMFVYIKVVKDANSHLIIISENQTEDYENSYPSLVSYMNFPKIFLSIIQHDIYRKKEIMLVTLFGFSFNLTQFTKCIEWKLELTDLQIDSQIFEFVVCPIFFISDGEDPLALSGRLVLTEKWTCLEKIRLDMKNFIVNLDNNLLESILNFYKRFFTETNYNLDYYLTCSADKNDLLTGAWIFLSDLCVSSFVIKFSYKNANKNAKDHFMSFLVNFDDIIIFLEETHYVKLYGSPSTISGVISAAYHKMIMSNLDLILKQHGMIGGALMLAVKLSNGIAKIGKKSNTKDSREAKLVYQEKLRQHRQNNTIRFTRCLKSEEMQDEIGRLKEKSGIDSFTELVNDPVNSFLGLFKKKKNIKEDPNIITKYKQRTNRVFYGRFSVIQPYSFDDCHVASILRIKNQDFCGYFFYGQSFGTNYRNGKKIVAVVFDRAAVLMDDESNILWEINPICIESVQKIKENLVICGLDKNGRTVKFDAGFIEMDSVKKFQWLIKEVRRELNN